MHERLDRMLIPSRKAMRTMGPRQVPIPSHGPMAFSAVWRDDEFVNLARCATERARRNYQVAHMHLLLSRKTRLARSRPVLP